MEDRPAQRTKGSQVPGSIAGIDQRVVAPPKSLGLRRRVVRQQNRPARELARPKACGQSGIDRLVAICQSSKSPAAQAERAPRCAAKGCREYSSFHGSQAGQELESGEKVNHEDDSNRDGRGRRHEAIPRVHSRCRKRWSHWSRSLISRTYHPACHFENLFLLTAHIFCPASGLIVPAGQMQESMDKAKSSFLVGSVAEASRVAGDDTGSDQNLRPGR